MTDAAEVRAIIEQHNVDICEWYASGNVDAIAERFAEDCWQMNPNAEPLVGRGAVREFWGQATQWGRWDFDLQTQDVVVSGDIAVERGSGTLRFTVGPAAPPGMPSLEDRANYVVMWRLEPDGEWRIVWDAPVSVGQLL